MPQRGRRHRRHCCLLVPSVKLLLNCSSSSQLSVLLVSGAEDWFLEPPGPFRKPLLEPSPSPSGPDFGVLLGFIRTWLLFLCSLMGGPFFPFCSPGLRLPIMVTVEFERKAQMWNQQVFPP